MFLLCCKTEGLQPNQPNQLEVCTIQRWFFTFARRIRPWYFASSVLQINRSGCNRRIAPFCVYFGPYSWFGILAIDSPSYTTSFEYGSFDLQAQLKLLVAPYAWCDTVAGIVSQVLLHVSKCKTHSLIITIRLFAFLDLNFPSLFTTSSC